MWNGESSIFESDKQILNSHRDYFFTQGYKSSIIKQNVQKLKTFIIAIFCICFLGVANSQISKKPSHYIFKPQWYVSASGGVNLFVSEGFGSYPATKGIGSIAQTSVGYSFTPVIGIKGALGFVNHKWPDIRFDNTTIPLKAQNLTVDLTLNLSNYFGGYNLRRLFDFSAFAGTGITHRNIQRFSKDAFLPVFRGGFQGDMHLTQLIDLNLITECNFLNDSYNEYTSGIPVDIYPTVLVGIAYHFR